MHLYAEREARRSEGRQMVMGATVGRRVWRKPEAGSDEAGLNRVGVGYEDVDVPVGAQGGVGVADGDRGPLQHDQRAVADRADLCEQRRGGQRDHRRRPFGVDHVLRNRTPQQPPPARGEQVYPVGLQVEQGRRAVNERVDPSPELRLSGCAGSHLAAGSLQRDLARRRRNMPSPDAIPPTED